MNHQATRVPAASKQAMLPSKPGFHSFHQLLFDRLMPWLPFNHDAMVFKTLGQGIEGKQHSFFSGLADRLKTMGIVDDPLLRAEWHTFTTLVPDERWLVIYKSIDKNLAPDARIYFFQQYILHSMLFTGSLLSQVMTQSSTATQQFVLNSFMKRLKDFQNRCHELYEAENEGVAPILYLLSGVLFVMENEVVKCYKPQLDKKYLALRFTPLMSEAMPHTHNRQMAVHFHLWLQNTYPGLPHSPVARRQQPQQQVAEPTAKYGTSSKETSRQHLQSEKEDTANNLLNSDEASALLGIRRNTLLKHAKEGKVPHTHIGRLYKFRRADIEAFRQQKDQPHTSKYGKQPQQE